MSTPKTTKVLVNAKPPIGPIKPDTFAVQTRDLPELQDGQVLIKVLAFGNEPAQRGWIDGAGDPKRAYIPPVGAGEVVRAIYVGEIVASKSPKWAVGSRVTTISGWEEYCVMDGDNMYLLPNIEIPGHSLWTSLGALGVPGRTAWVAAFKECNLKAEHTVLVSGAAGAVGLMFVQIAKHIVGCQTVVGIAGGKEKCDWVKSLGADECLDYKDMNFSQNLKAALPDYADVYLDNIGGEVLNQALTVVKQRGLIICSGSISGYNGNAAALSNWFEIIANHLTIRGFLHQDHWADFAGMTGELAQWIAEGKIKLGEESETVVKAKFEDVPKVWGRLFTGEKKGKLITVLE